MAVQDATVFIGSSSEGKRYAEYLQAALDEYCESAVWDQGTFGLSESSLHALVSESQRVDFAVLVLTPDDLTLARDLERPSARDNVIFEVGLFVGALGPERTVIVRANDVDLSLPSDLAGITTCTFRSQRTDANLRAAVNPAALRIREVLQDLGKRDRSDAIGESNDRSSEPITWNRDTVLAALSERFGSEQADLARHLFKWADGRPGLSNSFGRGKKDGAWLAGYQDTPRYLWPFVLYTYGRIEIQFQHIAKRPPFDDRFLRNELRLKLNTIPGVSIPEERLERRPSIDLLALRTAEGLEAFTDAMAWAFDQADHHAESS
jgi:hypothetical protein